MAVELCLMASNGYSPGSGLVLHHQEQNRLFKDYQPYFPGQLGRHEIARSNSLNLRANQLSKIEPPVAKPVLIDVQETHADSVLFSYGIAEQCVKHEKIMQFLTSGTSELEREGLDLSLLSDLMGIQALTDVHQHPPAPLLYPSGELEAPKPLVDFIGDMARSSKITICLDGRVMFNGSKTEMKDILSVVAEFYLSKNFNKWRRHSVLVPHFSRLDTIEIPADTLLSSLKIKDFAVAPLKSPEKVQSMPSTKKKKKKNSKKGVKDRDLYERNYFHACESLLTLLMDKKGNGKAAILSLKKSGPELSNLLTQVSAGIAGTGLAVLFSVFCKVACTRVPFCSSKLFTTGFGVGLVWLSWAVNKLRDTILYLSKNATKISMTDKEVMRHVDRSLKEVYFRAATVMAVAVLRLA